MANCVTNISLFYNISWPTNLQQISTQFTIHSQIMTPQQSTGLKFGQNIISGEQMKNSRWLPSPSWFLTQMVFSHFLNYCIPYPNICFTYQLPTLVTVKVYIKFKIPCFAINFSLRGRGNFGSAMLFLYKKYSIYMENKSSFEIMIKFYK